ncbi:MAG: hypothetical protein WCH44_01775 [Betaproteobacteria bacterium]
MASMQFRSPETGRCETSLGMEAHAALAKEGIATRVVSMPCSNLFDRQSQDYQESVLPLAVRELV